MHACINYNAWPRRFIDIFRILVSNIHLGDVVHCIFALLLLLITILTRQFKTCWELWILRNKCNLCSGIILSLIKCKEQSQETMTNLNGLHSHYYALQGGVGAPFFLTSWICSSLFTLLLVLYIMRNIL